MIPVSAAEKILDGKTFFVSTFLDKYIFVSTFLDKYTQMSPFRLRMERLYHNYPIFARRMNHFKNVNGQKNSKLFPQTIISYR